jgi:hypothetical protein
MRTTFIVSTVCPVIVCSLLGCGSGAPRGAEEPGEPGPRTEVEVTDPEPGPAPEQTTPEVVEPDEEMAPPEG